MLMKCAKCGYENQLNAIFCRGCGEKIDPAEVTPENLAEAAAQQKKAGRKFNWKPIVGLLLLALIVTYGIMLFTTPSGSPVYNKEENVAYKNTLKDIQSVSDDIEERLEKLRRRELLPADVLIELCEKVLLVDLFNGKG